MTEILVRKRNSDLVEFDKNKIVQAIIKAMNETETGIDEDLAWDIAEDIELEFEDSDIIPTIESVSDRVEELLSENGRFDASKRYILYRNERSKLRNQGWEMTDLQRDIYEKKYRFGNETFDEFLNRVSGGNEKIKKLMRDKRFLPAGRILAGRGLNETGRKVSYSNCFVITPPEDNLESIFDTAKKMARTYSLGGGCGTSLEKLRPRNAKVNNAAESTTGSVSFADLYSMTTGLIGQNSRRGALMLSMPVTHPDVEEFIDVKTDLDRVTKANISLMITDDFMKAVKENKEWIMKFVVEDTGQVITRKAKARDIMYKLAKNNWSVAEPGAIFWDRVEKWHLNSENKEFKYASTNPCQPKGEFILTKDGFRKIEDIKDNVVLNGFEYQSTEMFPTGEKEVFEVELENGAIIKMTDNHLISTPDGFDLPLKELKVGDRVLVDYNSIHSTNIDNMEEYEKGILAGWFIADGGYHKTDKRKPDMGFCIGENEFEYKDTLESIIQKYITPDFQFEPHNQKPDTCYVGRIHKDELIDKFSNEMNIRNYDKFTIELYNKSKDFKLGFLKAIFTCDGSSRSEGISCLYSTNKHFMHDVQRLLIEFGVYSTVTIHGYANSYISTDGVVRNNADCWKVSSYDVDFSRIGYLTEYKNNSMNQKIKKGRSARIDSKKKSLKIKNITSVGVMSVYDITVDDIHHYNTNGLVVHNCGEKPLVSGGSCLLSSFNLSEYVKNPFSNNAIFDYNSFAQDVKDSVIYMNDLLDEGIPYLPLDEQKESARKYRQLGIGCMGLADMFIKMKATYGDDKSKELIRQIFHLMANSAIQQSSLLAKKNGTYPAYDKDAILSSPYLKFVATEETYKMVEEYGLYNAELLSIAPTGSLSTMLGVSGGGEPIFSLSHTRKSESLGEDGEDVYYKVYAQVAREYMDTHNNVKEEDLPEYFITSMELDYRKRIEVQAELQKYIDSAISSTVNLPEETTIEEVMDLYMYAWEQGLKGVTVYRSGCERGGILTTDKKKNDKPKTVEEPGCTT